ncbi:MAG: hypothetical protein E6G97_05215 [Alphaproteobacteria bacterium]|nr:MAG: hypothetical protein E6G97_05215 [Alphaproteobacteria bacterium]
MATSGRMLWQSAAAVAAALFVSAIALGSSDTSHAQPVPKDHRAQKKAPPAKGPVQPLRRGPQAVGPNRVVAPQRPALAPGAMPQGARVAPHVNPALRGPARFGSNQPGNRAIGNQPGMRALGNQPRGVTNRDPRLRAVNARTPQLRQVQRTTHRNELFALRSRLPVRPLPGERNFTGVPPIAENRFVDTEMVCQWGPDMTQAGIDAIARQHNLTILAVQRSALTGGTLVHFRIGGGRPARDVVRAMEAERIVSQPNYVYDAVQQPAAAEPSGANSEQYVVSKLRLAEVHKIATGKDVLIAVIDSEIDRKHPEFANAIAEQFDAVGQPEKPHAHGTGMAGAIVSQSRLMGIAPGARALAVHAFSMSAQQSPQATTRHIIAGLEWALTKGARIVNMSFAGPYDPMLALAMKKASEKGVILIAAVGNAGPKSPPLYPAADPHVIGVTATDEADGLFKGANVGAQVAVAAPGVDVMVPAPAEAYQLTTGTSVAAAHVSGVAALLLERHPNADAATVLEVLTASATKLGTDKRDDRFGWGLIDPLAALAELDARLADTKVAGATPAPATTAAPVRTPSAAAPAPAAAATRPALPRPGIYVPKQ